MKRRTKKQAEALRVSWRKEVRRTGKWCRRPGDCCLEMPHLQYSSQGDPVPDLITIDRTYVRKNKKIGRVFFLPRVRIAFPSKNLRDGKAVDVLQLPKRWVKWVLDQEFAIPWANIPSVEYLFRLGRNLWGDPLLQGFDTAVRDGLSSISEESIYRAFWLLSDYRHDPKDPKRKNKDAWEAGALWAKLATYIFWAECSQVGAGLPYFFARLDEGEGLWKGSHKKVVEGLSWTPTLPVSKKGGRKSLKG